MKKILVLSMLFIAGFSFLFAGGKKETSGTVLYAATQADYPPFCYVDDQNKLTGFDVEVINAIAERLPGYTIDLQTLGWEGIFLSLESRRVEIIGDQIAVNAEREEKFLFSEPYFESQAVIIIKKGRTDIKNLKDLEGKNVLTIVGDNFDMLVTDYNEKNGNRIIQHRVEGNPESNLEDVQNGKYDAHVNDPVMVKAIIDKHNLDLEIVAAPVQGDRVALVFNKDARGRELKALIDPVIRELKADGTLSRLSVKWTGGDFIPK